MTAFLITGLPRSKTAWMSVVASCCIQDAICYHEPLERLSRWQDVETIWRESKYRYVGISDSSLSLHLDWIIDRIGPRVLVIRRDTDDVIRSLERLNAHKTNICDLIADRLSRYESHPLVMSVAFSALSSEGVVVDCLSHLALGSTLHEMKIPDLIKMNIQVDPDHVRSVAKIRANDARELLGTDVMSELRSIA